MPIRHGNTYRAFGWLIAANLCAALYASEALGQAGNDIPRESPKRPAEAVTQQENPPAPPVIPPEPAEPVASPEVYEPDCGRPDSREEADLCAQRRMANAAEDTVEWVRKSVEWAESQYYATVGEIIALVVTILVAALAVGAAFRANRIAGESAEHQLRAYMLPEKVSFLENETGNLQIAVKLKNTGQTPARKVRHITRCGVGAPNAKDFNYDIPTGRVFGDIGPNLPTHGHFYQTDGNDFIGYSADLLTGEKVFYVWGRLEYFDIFDREQTTDYRFRWSPEHDEFVDCDEGNKAT